MNHENYRYISFIMADYGEMYEGLNHTWDDDLCMVYYNHHTIGCIDSNSELQTVQRQLSAISTIVGSYNFYHQQEISAKSNIEKSSSTEQLCKIEIIQNFASFIGGNVEFLGNIAKWETETDYKQYCGEINIDVEVNTIVSQIMGIILAMEDRKSKLSSAQHVLTIKKELVESFANFAHLKVDYSGTVAILYPDIVNNNDRESVIRINLNYSFYKIMKQILQENTRLITLAR